MFSRYARRNVEAALADTRVVLLEGPRQSGKTTLVKSFEDSGRRYLSLDDAATRALAISDPVSFIRNLDRAIIDEVQRAPDLLLAIKSSVDSDGRPGRFLLTGSANLMSLSTVADSLAGRMEILPLLPLAQAEIFGSRSTFLENVFCGVAPKADRIVIGQSLIDRVLQGGYPEAVARTTWDRRYRWQEAYTRSLILRDVQDVAQIQDLAMLPRLLQVLAEHSAQLVNYSRMG
jgi:predicted AAA+ superfamily ATPase